MHAGWSEYRNDRNGGSYQSIFLSLAVHQLTKNEMWEKSYFIFYDFTTNGCRQQGHSAFRLLSIHELIHVS